MRLSELSNAQLVDQIEERAGGTLAAEVNRRLNQPQPVSDEMRELEEAYQTLLAKYETLRRKQ